MQKVVAVNIYIVGGKTCWYKSSLVKARCTEASRCKSWLVEANRFEAAPGVNAGIWGAVSSVTSKNTFVLQSFAVFKPL